MGKKIVYTAVYTGEDGKGEHSVEFASWDENMRDNFINNKGIQGKQLYIPKEEIVDIEVRKTEALIRLGAIDRLVLER